MLKGLNKRRRKLLWKLATRTRLNRAFLKYLKNRIAILRLNRDKNLTVAYPTNVMIELGNVCNLHCSMCPREHDYGKAMDVGFMPVEHAKRIIDQIYPYLDSCGLTGLGETFLYPHFPEIVRYIKNKKKSIIITVSTNAHFRGFREAVEPVLPYIDNIQFSIDGLGDTYEAIRKGASFEEVVENIRFTMKKGKDVTYMINCVVSPENYSQMSEIVLFARQLDIHYVNFNCESIASQPKAERSFYDFFVSEDFKKAVEELRQTCMNCKDMEVTGPWFTTDGSFHDCIFPWEYPYITWDGYYVPCCGKPFPKLLNFGNVFNEDIIAVLNSKKAQQFRKLWQKNTPPTFCHNCQLTNN